MTPRVTVYYLVFPTPEGRWQRLDDVDYATLLEGDAAAQRAKGRRPDLDVRIMSERVPVAAPEPGEDEG